MRETKDGPLTMPMAEPVRGGLRPADLDRVAALEAACVRADGVRLKLEWPTLRGRPADRVNDWVVRDRDTVIGFCGLYSFQPGEFELCGMVAPGHRRRGLARALFDAAVAEASSRLTAPGQLLIITDRAYPAGAAFATAVGATYHSSEFPMRLTERPVQPDDAAPLTMRAAELADGPFVAACLGQAFGVDPNWVMPDPARRAITLFLDGDRPIGMIHVESDGDVARLYGFAVPPELRGRGLGGRALRLITGTLLDAGHTAIELEVLTSNDSALGLYLRNGFRSIGTLDYHELRLRPTGPADPDATGEQ